ncbi:alanine racemase [Labedella gwakjiensis]|uniref:Alanine racemase n=2 Tax=Labedella gwakjiensis TaxID=390269 RepID=A0A2P8GRW1_9MICO|nr:alanine racemase [Labedella gwakjiensis]
MTGLREAVVDLDAVSSNVRRMQSLTGGRIIAVVKADGYGHGAQQVARAALRGGAEILGTADVDEALALRASGIDAPLLSWLHAPDQDFAPAVAAGVALGVSSERELLRAADASTDGAPAHIHVKFDTGLSRNGVPRSEWTRVVDATASLVGTGRVDLDGIFTHLSNTSDDDDRAAVRVFEEAIELVGSRGLNPGMIHAAATAAAIAVPESRFDTVRLGIGMYGFSPVPGVTGASLGLVPAMSLVSRVASVKTVAPGTGVSYGYRYRTTDRSTLALIPVGYADGIPRQASSLGEVAIRGRRHRVAGRIAMDQFVVDVGDEAVEVGDEVILFGDPATGVPSAAEWAEHAGTIDYDIVTRIGPRVPRRYTGGA